MIKIIYFTIFNEETVPSGCTPNVALFGCAKNAAATPKNATRKNINFILCYFFLLFLIFSKHVSETRQDAGTGTVKYKLSLFLLLIRAERNVE
jgi:hypothetical protein